jgi:hypothetical protein
VKTPSTASLRALLLAASLLTLGLVAYLSPGNAADTVSLTGSVSSARGTVSQGWVSFYTSCSEYEAKATPTLSTWFRYGTYAANLPAGTYVVLIEPSAGTHALKSWHTAASECAQATTVTADTDRAVNLKAIGGSSVSGTIRSSNGAVDSGYIDVYTECGRAGNVETVHFEGGYHLTLPDGTYKFAVSPHPSSGALFSWHNAAADCQHAETVTVSGDTTADLVIKAGSLVSGQISSARGPLSGGRVSFYPSCDASPFAARFGSSSYAVTVPDGTYKVLIVPEPDTEAATSWHSAQKRCEDAQTVVVAGRTQVDLTAAAGWTVSGRASTMRGDIADGRVEFYAECGGLRIGSAAITNGRYRVTLPVGTFRVAVSEEGGLGSWHSAKTTCADSDVVTVAGDQTLDVVGRANYQLTGTVTTPNGLVGRGWVSFYESCEDAVDDWALTRVPLVGGSFSVTLQEGSYVAYISPDRGQGAYRSFNGEAAVCEESKPATVTGTMQALNLTARAGFDVTGSVRGMVYPIASGDVFFYQECDGDPLDGSHFDNGEYLVTVPDGDYRVAIRTDSGFGGEYSWHSGEVWCDNAEVVPVSQDTRVDLLALNRDDLSGTVTTANGPLAQGNVLFYSSCEDAARRSEVVGAPVKAGHFSARIPPGTFTARVYDSRVGVSHWSWNGGVSTCEDSPTITVAGPTNADITADAVSKITFNMVTAGGTPVPGNLRIYRTCTDQNAVVQVSSQDGTAMAGLLNGQYYARVLPSEGMRAVSSWHPGRLTCASAEPITAAGDTDMDLTVAEGVVLTGRVVDAGDSGSVVFSPACESTPAGSATFTDGGYSIAVAPGQYRVQIFGTGPPSWHGRKQRCEDSATVTVVSDATLDLYALALGQVSGAVSSSRGPVNSGRITWYGSCEAWLAGTPTDDTDFQESRFQASVPAGTYKVFIAPSAGTRASPSWNGAAPDCASSPIVVVNSGFSGLDLSALPAMTVSGRVTGDIGPSGDGGLAWFTRCDAEPVSRGFTDGQYTIEVPPGQYEVLITPGERAGSWHPEADSCAQASTVTVTSDMHLDLAARPSASTRPSPSTSTSSNPGTTAGTKPQSRPKVPKFLKRGKRVRLAAATAQGAPLTWTSLTRRICMTAGTRVRGIRKGKCRILATAPAVQGFEALRTSFRMKVK